jgi:hypothetical protein
VTALLDLAKLKWKDLITSEVPIPTPWQKAEYESLSRDFQQHREQLRKARRPEAEFDELLRENKAQEARLLDQEAFAGKLGAFEGANYDAKGYYRPQVTCIMFTRIDFFGAVCRRALTQVIDQYTTEPKATP